MSIKLGTTGIASIFKGTTKIGSVYKGRILVFSSQKTYHSNFSDSVVTLADSSGNYQYNSASGTAVAGTQYYDWNSSTRLFQTVSVAEGTDVSSYYTLNSSFTSENTVGVHVYNIGTFANTTQMIIGQMQYGDGWYDIYDTTKNTFDLENALTSNVTEVIIYNVYKYKSEHSQSIDTGVYAMIKVNGTSGLNNCSKISMINSCARFYAEIYGGSEFPERVATIGLNVQDGVEILIDGCIYVPEYFAGNEPTLDQSHKVITGVGKYKSITFKGDNLKYIGDMAFHSYTLPLQCLGVELPQSLRYLGGCNSAIAYSGTSDNDLVYNIQNSNLKWISITSGTIPAGTYGLASPHMGMATMGIVYDQVRLSSYNLPSTLRELSADTLTSNKAETFYINSNLLTPLTNVTITSNFRHTLDFASNVTEINDGIFNDLSTIQAIYIRCPDGTPIDIEYRSLYYKSARAVSIYTDNTSVKNYDWSGNQNITPTFYHLDGTAWS